MKEYEIKFLVTKEHFFRLLQAVRRRFPEAPAKETEQVNFYYDTDDGYYNAQQTTVRVRKQGERYFLQVKRHHPDSFESDETKEEIDRLPCFLIRENSCVPLQGRLLTRRTTIRLTDSIELMFDQNEYLGCTDYEIEFEYSPEAESDAAVISASLGLTRPHSLTKSARFFRAAERIRVHDDP